MLTRAVNAFRKRRPKGGADQEGLASETETETEDCASCRSEPIGRLNSDTSTVSDGELAQLTASSSSGADQRGRSKRFAGFTGSTSSAASLLRLRSRSRSKDVGLAQSTISNGGRGEKGSKNPDKCCVNCGGSGTGSGSGKGKGKTRQKLRRAVQTETPDDVMDGGSGHGTPTPLVISSSDGGGSGRKTGVDWFDGFGGLVFLMFLKCDERLNFRLQYFAKISVSPVLIVMVCWFSCCLIL